MRVLVIGSGAREHTLVWKLAQSKRAEQLFAIPGNPGMANFATCRPDIAMHDQQAIITFCQQEAIDFVVIGPEMPLAEGLADVLREAQIKVFGPSQRAAEIESSKAFSKDLMQRYGIPTARYATFADAEAAKTYVCKMGAPIVIKADGLAAGKGVVVAMTEAEALSAIDDMMQGNSLGEAGHKVVVEEFMTGEEVSVLALCDGQTVRPLLPSQDHKRIYDGDRGPNTGGMGAYAPAPIATPALMAQVQREILEPTVRAMAKEGRFYQGCLYAGLMVTDEGPKVVEFNCRFGDPETQVVLPLLQSDLLELMLACADGKLADMPLQFATGAATCVEIVSGGYPKSYAKGYPITGIDEAKSLGALVFHAGTKQGENEILTNGGRVLSIVGMGADIRQATKLAYEATCKVHFQDSFYRHDIAHRALERLQNT